MTSVAVSIEVLSEALAHATAIKTLSPAGPVRTLATALRELLENASIATAAPLVENVGAPGSGDRSRPVATADRPEESATSSVHPEAVRSRRRRAKPKEEPPPPPPPVDDRQLDLFAGHDRSRPVGSSSSDPKDHFEEKKKTVSVATGDPLPDDMWRTAREVIARRGVDLEPEELWRAFVGYHVDHRTRFRSAGDLRWRWRRWVTMEKPARTPETPAGGADAAGTGPEPKSRPRARPGPALAPATRRPVGPIDPELGALIDAGARLVARAPPEPRSASA